MDIRLANNIKYLRKAYGETQEELGTAIFVEKSAISNYETRNRVPDKQTLTAIAKHFSITVEELLYDDFSNIGKFQVDNKLFFISIDEVLPIISSKDALNNKKFKKAHSAHIAFWQELKKVSLDGIDNIDICIDGYMDAIEDKDAKVPASANLVSILYLFIFLFKNVPSFVSNRPACLLQISKKDDAARQNIEENCNSDFAKDCKEITELFYDKETKETVENCLYVLKCSKFSDLADYYMALQYAWNIIDNDLSSEFNRRVGSEMLSALLKFKNRYSARYLLLSKKIAGAKSTQNVDDK